MKIRRNTDQKRRRVSSGIALIEATIGLGGLVVVSLLLFKASLSATAAQRWTVIQAMTDAYMTRETAVAKRVPFDDILALDSLWPAHPAMSTQEVELGRLPGGFAVTATLNRTRIADVNNFASAGGSGSAISNPAKMEVWRLRSFLDYSVAQRQYVKSRTVIRTR